MIRNNNKNIGCRLDFTEEQLRSLHDAGLDPVDVAMDSTDLIMAVQNSRIIVAGISPDNVGESTVRYLQEQAKLQDVMERYTDPAVKKIMKDHLSKIEGIDPNKLQSREFDERIADLKRKGDDYPSIREKMDNSYAQSKDEIDRLQRQNSEQAERIEQAQEQKAAKAQDVTLHVAQEKMEESGELGKLRALYERAESMPNQKNIPRDEQIKAYEDFLNAYHKALGLAPYKLEKGIEDAVAATENKGGAASLASSAQNTRPAWKTHMDQLLKNMTGGQMEAAKKLALQSMGLPESPPTDEAAPPTQAVVTPANRTDVAAPQEKSASDMREATKNEIDTQIGIPPRTFSDGGAHYTTLVADKVRDLMQQADALKPTGTPEESLAILEKKAALVSEVVEIFPSLIDQLEQENTSPEDSTKKKDIPFELDYTQIQNEAGYSFDYISAEFNDIAEQIEFLNGLTGTSAHADSVELETDKTVHPPAAEGSETTSEPSMTLPLATVTPLPSRPSSNSFKV